MRSERPACEHAVNFYSTFAPFSQCGLPSGAVETSCSAAAADVHVLTRGKVGGPAVAPGAVLKASLA